VAKILVSGLITIETTLKIEQFPQPYFPVCYPFFGVQASVSGVGYNVALALGGLGHEVRMLSILGRDLQADLVRLQLGRDGIDGRLVLPLVEQTSQSVILYDPTGRRQIHCDLKDLQETAYPEATFREALAGCAAAVLTTMNYNRPFLAAAKAAGVPVAADFHVTNNLHDAYHLDFYRHAGIIFFSDANLTCPPGEWARRVHETWGTRLVVIGCGEKGAWLFDPAAGHDCLVPAVQTRPVVNTIGAGDALFSSFLHGWLGTGDSLAALRRAVVFASWKIGVASASQGFPSLVQWDALVAGGA
jgi:ribokinase